MTTLRILVVTHMFPRVDLQRQGVFLVREAQFLREQDVESCFLVPSAWAPWPMTSLQRWRIYGASNRLCKVRDLPTREFKYFRPPGAWFRHFEGRSMARSLLRPARKWHSEAPFHAVLSCPFIPGGEAGLRIADALGLPLAVLAIGSDVLVHPRRQPRLERKIQWICERADLVVGVSEAICQRLAPAGNSQRSPLCVYLGRDEAVFHPAENKRKLREDLGWSTHEIVAIFVGQVGEPKGMQELIEAAEPLLRRHQNFRLVCVGSGGMLDEIVEMQRRTGRHDAVSLPGTVPPEDVARYLQASDFLVFPSHSEGMPQAVLEAANCGLGAVATRVGGIPEAVIDGETGILVDVNAPDQLQQAMERMICDEGFRRTAGRNSLILAKSKFDARLNAAKFAHALKSLARAQPAEA